MLIHKITYLRSICLQIFIDFFIPFGYFSVYDHFSRFHSGWIYFSFLPSDMKQVYEDLKEQLSKLSRALKILETRALKQTFSTNEIASKVSY